MDDPSTVFERLALQIERAPLPPLPFVGQAQTLRTNNPPAPHLELILQGAHASRSLHIGSLTCELPPHHLCLYNVHFGNWTDPAAPHTPVPPGQRSWCLFLDIHRWRGWSDWTKRPRFIALPTRNRAQLQLLFEMLALSCHLTDFPEPRYLIGRPSHDPNLPGHDDPVRRMRIRAALLNLLSAVLENARPLLRNSGGPDRDPHSAVHAALQQMKLHFDDPTLSLDRLAEAANLSPAHFGMVFRRQMACTPMRYLRRLRMEQARSLLREGPWRIHAIARSVGYTDPLHFSRVYRQEMGRSPRQDRPEPSAPPPEAATRDHT